MSILEQILAHKRGEVQRAQARLPGAGLKALAAAQPPPRHFLAAQRAAPAPAPAVIAAVNFIVDAYQVPESRWLGADAILRIARLMLAEQLHALAFSDPVADGPVIQPGVRDAAWTTAVARLADGVVVGSAMIAVMEAAPAAETVQVSALGRQLREGVDAC